MKFRFALVLVAAAGALLPPIAARAEHCDSPIYLFSTTRIQTEVDNPADPGTPIGRSVPSAASSAVGCTVRDEATGEDPSLHEATDSDFIYPAANRMSVRLFENGADPSIIASATLTFAGDTYALDLQPSVDVTGATADWLDSQSIEIDPADTLGGNEAVIEICIVDEADCYTRTYRTIA